MMDNIPVIKLGLVAVSRDCFPIALSEKRRAAIAAKCGQKELNFVEIKTTVENEKDMLKARLRVPGQLRTGNSRNPDRQVLRRTRHVRGRR